ncbi:tumor necrosis factor receptor superfamily member 5 isoform X2 [Suricata suricatta]|uniref:tumor necrosis factor receptor superfamily member 5 isoform X2 n=1 Tax=Suricata suricatta TaxID=37032 RepID=UPI001155E087|nr:tumor necrosis factor receptor superfamily member 5 isoform X2 [Suricata suricatta]
MVLLRLRCLLWGCLLSTVHPEPHITCGENQYVTNNHCCDMCQPGKKLVNDCTEFTTTECVSCKTGEFLDTWNRERHCHQHKYCDPNLGLKVQKEGTSDTDTTCRCDEGLHCTTNACESCTQHTPCPPGLGVKQVGLQDRIRALVAIPITMVILLAVLLVSAYIRKVTKGPGNKVIQPKKCQIPVEDLEDPIPLYSIAPVQETLHGCQPVTQEDGKESRISVQERI